MRMLLRWLGRAALVLYVFLVIVVLGVRYWLLPHIDQWRAPIAQALSVATDSQVEIGKLSAQWEGFLPELQIDDLLIQNTQKKDQPQQQLQIPQITARIKWQSILDRQLQFSYLRIDGLHIDLWRDAQQQIHIAEQNDTSAGFIAWLAQQDQIELNNAQIVWRDQTLDSMPLRVSNVQGVLQFKEEALQFNLAASLQAELGQSLQIQGQFARADLDKHQLNGTVYVQLNELSPAVWRQWIDLPTNLTQATLDTQFWLDIKQSKITHISMDTRVYNGVWQAPEFGQLKADSLRIFASAPWQGFKFFADEIPLGQGLQSGSFEFEVYGKNVQWQNPQMFATPLHIDEIAFASERQTEQDEGLVQIQQLLIKNKDVIAELQGTWQPKGTNLSMGEFDVLGTLNEVQINRIYSYMPMPDVSKDVVAWLQHALVKGVVPSATVRLQGNLHDFPYDEPQSGLFYVGGPFIDAEIDYYLPNPGEIGWPKVEDARGYLALRGNGLWVNADSAVLKPNGKDPVDAKQVQAHIDDLAADEPILTIQGQTTGAAQAYLGLMSHSDLGGLLGHAFEHSSATGQWQVPLDLRINIENEDDVEVKGSIEFMSNTVQLLPFLPSLEGVVGRLYFNENGARAENIKAKWLGGSVSIKDEVGPAGQMLQLKGQAKTNALAQYSNLAALSNRLDGDFLYQLQVGFDKKDQFYIKGLSDLKGVSSTFPAPLAKSAEVAMPLQFTWQASSKNKNLHEFQVQLDNKLQMRLIENTVASPLFSHGSVGWQQPLPELPVREKGFVVDIKQDHLDLDAWQQVQEELSIATSTSTTSTSTSANSIPTIGLKDFVRLRIKSDQALWLDSPLEQLTYTMQQNQNHHWRADISSKQVAGTVLWQADSKGQVVGVVEAKLQRLHWAPHAQAEENTNEEPADFELRLPSIRLNIENLRWQNWRLGSLQLEGRKSIESNSRWQIPTLLLHTPHGDLSGVGFWQLAGPERGLKLNAQVQSDDAGQLLSFVGMKEVLAEGRGSIQAQVQWLNFPWTTELDTLNATIDLDLHKGRIDQINSRTAKVLEFLSLQSLSRLSRLDFDLRGITKNGFPFDDMKGRLDLKQQLLSTDNFRVVGPAGTIVIEGETDISAEQLNLRAVVVPNVDMSGAAIAAGIALNPVIGIGAFVTQLLFKDPLAKAMSVQYQLTGPWDQFETEEMKLKPSTEYK